MILTAFLFGLFLTLSAFSSAAEAASIFEERAARHISLSRIRFGAAADGGEVA